MLQEMHMSINLLSIVVGYHKMDNQQGANIFESEAAQIALRAAGAIGMPHLGWIGFGTVG